MLLVEQQNLLPFVLREEECMASRENTNKNLDNPVDDANDRHIRVSQLLYRRLQNAVPPLVHVPKFEERQVGLGIEFQKHRFLAWERRRLAEAISEDHGCQNIDIEQAPATCDVFHTCK